MLREELLQKTVSALQEAGFETAQQISPSCFDILARRADKILLVKVLTNVDSFYEEQAADLKRVGDVLGATALLVGVFVKSEYMRPKTIYERYGIMAINFETFEESILEKKLPVVYAKKGGFYANINPEFLKQIRERNKLSVGALAREAGISKKSLQNYERGQGAEIGNILRLQQALGDLELNTINIFQHTIASAIQEQKQTGIENAVSKRLGRIGFKTATVQRASFRIIGKHREDILLTGLRKQPLEKKAHDIHDTAEALGQHGMFVFEHARKKVVAGVPILEKEELEHVVSSRELLKLLKELTEEH
ncbi:TPA: transcriptional regulator [archaeon]|uniref:Putative HTH-type transcriptional regulatory protein H1016_05570 n=1 Tax=Candidatus Naiadarchaeum limnaeum TaxID=2756139 RepID=A0A832V4W5_9ARCH|nr:transcriptional regulator [Candidatus Naiadarchaeales archaeon SRR2090153.bin1042]HIK00972.1 transcriptional regulator [Candidatus Naiadarchaeum limnaeum]